MPKFIWIGILCLTVLFSGCNTPRRIAEPPPPSITTRNGITVTGKFIGIEDSWVHLQMKSGNRYTVSLENFPPQEQKKIKKSSKKLKEPPAWVTVIEGQHTFSKDERLFSMATRQPVTGRVIMRTPSGKKRSQLSFYNGYLHGLCTYWNNQGNREAEIEYNKGISHGISVHWHENQSIQSRAYYYEGKLHGTLDEFFPDGKRKSKSSWQNGIPVDIMEEWYQSGHLARQYKYDQGRLWSRLEWNVYGDLVRMERIPVNKP